MAEEEKEHNHEHKEEHEHNHEKEIHEHEHREEHVHHEHNEEHHKDEHAHEKEHEHHEHHEQKAEKAAKEKEGGEAAFKPTGEKRDLLDSRVSMLVFTAAGALMGAISLLLKPIAGSYMVGFLGIVLDIIVLVGLGKAMKRKSKFLLAGFFVYLLVWLVSWIFMFNLAPA